MVHHVFTRCRAGRAPRSPHDAVLSSGSQDSVPLSDRGSFMMPTPESDSVPYENGHLRDGDPLSTYEGPSALPPLPLPFIHDESNDVESENTDVGVNRKGPDGFEEPQLQIVP